MANEKPIRILIVDDHSVVRKGLLNLLEDEEDIEIVGEATDGDEALDMIPLHSPDVVLLDITMPRMSGIEVTREATRSYPTVRILGIQYAQQPRLYSERRPKWGSGLPLEGHWTGGNPESNQS